VNAEQQTPVTFARRLAVGLGCAAGCGFLAGLWVGTLSLVQNPTIGGFVNGSVTLLFFAVLVAALCLPLGLATGTLGQALSFVGRPRPVRFDYGLALGSMAAVLWFADAWDRSYAAQQLIRMRGASLALTRDEARAELYLLVAVALGVGLLAGLASYVLLGLGSGRERPGNRGRFVLCVGTVALVALAVFRPAPQFHAPTFTADMARPTDVKVRLVVIDGADWRFIDPLLEQGALPNLSALIERGVRAELGVTYPSESPHMWTTLSTGLEDDVNGLCEFYAYRPPGTDALITRFPGLGDARRFLFRQGILYLNRWGLGSVIPASSYQKRVPEIWDYLCDAGKTVAVVGWRYSAPVAEVKGALISDEYGEREAPYPLLYPADLAPRIDFAEDVERQMQLMAGEHDYTAGLKGSPPRIRRMFRMKLEGLRSNLQRDLMYVHASRDLQQTLDPDFSATAMRAVDGVEHQAMIEHVLHRAPERGPLVEPVSWFTSDEAIEKTGDGIVNIYRVADELLGTLLADVGDDLVIVVSDHGHDLDGSGHRFGPPGILVMAGGPVTPGASVDGATVFDVLPTTLHALGLPVPAGLRGRALIEAYDPAWIEAHPVEVVFTDAADAKVVSKGDAMGELTQEQLDELKALGYVD
jgi:hypothetical protein